MQLGLSREPCTALSAPFPEEGRYRGPLEGMNISHSNDQRNERYDRLEEEDASLARE
jgi:hypothetical protein